MSTSTEVEAINRSINQALALAGAALEVALAPHRDVIDAADAKVQECKRASSAASARFNAARAALPAVRQAAAISKVGAVTDALKAAEEELATAEAAFHAATQACEVAEDERYKAADPVRSFQRLYADLKRLSESEEARLEPTGDLRFLAYEVLNVATRWYPSIAAAQQAVEAAQQARVAQQAMQAALSHSATQANKRAAEAADLECQRAEAAAEENAPELQAAREAVKQFESLRDAVLQVVRDIDAWAAPRRARRAREAERRARLAEAARSPRFSVDDGGSASSSSPCRCTETYRCSYCYERQNDFATGQDYYRNKGPCD